MPTDIKLKLRNHSKGSWVFVWNLVIWYWRILKIFQIPIRSRADERAKFSKGLIFCLTNCLREGMFRTHSYDEMNPRTKQKCRKVVGRTTSRLLLDWNTHSRRQSWHSEQCNTSQGHISDFVRSVSSRQSPTYWDWCDFRSGDNTHSSPIVIISTPETRHHINICMVPPVAGTSHHSHYVQARPCIVSRNLRKIFGK